MKLQTGLALLILGATAAGAASQSTVTYLGNEGVLFSHGDTKVLFDPLFNNDYGQFQKVPESIRNAIFEGLPPYDGVDAVFVSHYHDDHFDPNDMLRLLRVRPGIQLIAPAQATDAIRELATAEDARIFDRVTALELVEGDAPVVVRTGDVFVEAAYVPHSGWPDNHSEIHNITFRVTLDGEGTVLHLGDADPNSIHFAPNEEYWHRQRADIALPPYWFLILGDGREILETGIDIGHVVGIHVPAAFAEPEKIPDPLRSDDLFTEPGESREVISEGSTGGK